MKRATSWRAGSLLVLAATVFGCSASREGRTQGDPGYLAAGPTTGLEAGGGAQPTALELLDQRNKELAAAREENARLVAETTRLETEGARLAAEVAELRARGDSSAKALASAEGELRSLKEALVRSRLLNVRLSQHLARLDLFGEDVAADASFSGSASEGEAKK